MSRPPEDNPTHSLPDATDDRDAASLDRAIGRAEEVRTEASAKPAGGEAVEANYRAAWELLGELPQPRVSKALARETLNQVRRQAARKVNSGRTIEVMPTASTGNLVIRYIGPLAAAAMLLIVANLAGFFLNSDVRTAGEIPMPDELNPEPRTAMGEAPEAVTEPQGSVETAEPRPTTVMPLDNGAPWEEGPKPATPPSAPVPPVHMEPVRSQGPLPAMYDRDRRDRAARQELPTETAVPTQQADSGNGGRGGHQASERVADEEAEEQHDGWAVAGAEASSPFARPVDHLGGNGQPAPRPETEPVEEALLRAANPAATFEQRRASGDLSVDENTRGRLRDAYFASLDSGAETLTFYGRTFRQGDGWWLDTAFQPNANNLTMVVYDTADFRLARQAYPSVRNIASSVARPFVLVVPNAFTLIVTNGR